MPGQTIQYEMTCEPTSPRPARDVGCGSWILERPLPLGFSLKSAWAVASDDVWAVGDKGSIVHWDGASWTIADSPTEANLSAVWGTDPKHVWAGGEGVLLVFDGAEWQERPSPTKASIEFITGSAADDIWVRGAGQDIFHWDGAGWTQPGSAPGAPDGTNWLAAWVGHHPIWPAGGGRAWSGACADGVDGVHASLYFWDGQAWTRTDTDVPGCIDAIAGTSPDDLWATAYSNSITCQGGCPSYRALHWDGVRWSDAPTGLEMSGDFFSPGRGEVWFRSRGTAEGAVIFARREAGAFREFFSLPPLGWWSAIAAASPTDVHIVGSNGLLAHSDGRATKVFGGPNTLGGVWSDDDGHAWVSGPGSLVLRRENGCWSTADLGSVAVKHSSYYGPVGFGLASGSRPDDLWIPSVDFAVHWDGQSFSDDLLPGVNLWKVWVSPAGRAYFASSRDPTDGVFRADGVGFTRIADGPVLAIGGTSDTDIWWLELESPGNTALVQFDGAATVVSTHIDWFAKWDADMRKFQSLSGFRASASDDIWALAGMNSNSLLHFDGVSVQDRSPSGTGYSGITGVAVAGRDDVWAASWDGVWHFDGKSWSKENVPGGQVMASGRFVYSLGNGRICRKP